MIGSKKSGKIANPHTGVIGGAAHGGGQGKPQSIPVVDFTADDTSGAVPLEVTFTGTASGNASKYVWYFGDGSVSTELNPVHTYEEVGTYTVTFMAFNGSGIGTEVKSNYITVEEVPSYTGPLDLVSGVVVAYGQRALSASKLGTALYTVREDSGDTTQSFSSDAVTGDAPIASIETFLNGANGFITSWVDQSSAASAVQATTTKQPQWGVDSDFSTIFFDGINDYLLTTGNVSLNNEWTLFAAVIPGPIAGEGTVAHRPICGQSSEDYQDHGPDWTVEPFLGAGGYWLTLIAEDTNYDNTLDVDIEDPPIVGFEESKHLVDCVISIPNRDLFIDGVELSLVDVGTSGTAIGAINEPFAIGASGQDVVGTGVRGYGKVLELIICQGIVSPSDRLAVRQNIATYYGITL